MAARTITALSAATALAFGAASCAPRVQIIPGPPHYDPRAAAPEALFAAARDFEAGVEAYGRGEYARSLSYFQRAYDTVPSAEVLFNLARVHDVMGHAPRAARYYVAYLRASPEAASEQCREIDAALARIRERVAWLVVRTAAEYEVDGEPVPALIRGAPLAIWPGIRSVRVSGSMPVMVRARAGEALEIAFDRPGTMLFFSAMPATDVRCDVIAGEARAILPGGGPAASSLRE